MSELTLAHSSGGAGTDWTDGTQHFSYSLSTLPWSLSARTMASSYWACAGIRVRSLQCSMTWARIVRLSLRLRAWARPLRRASPTWQDCGWLSTTTRNRSAGPYCLPSLTLVTCPVFSKACPESGLTLPLGPSETLILIFHMCP